MHIVTAIVFQTVGSEDSHGNLDIWGHCFCSLWFTSWGWRGGCSRIACVRITLTVLFNIVTRLYPAPVGPPLSTKDEQPERHSVTNFIPVRPPCLCSLLPRLQSVQPFMETDAQLHKHRLSSAGLITNQSSWWQSDTVPWTTPPLHPLFSIPSSTPFT